MKVLFLTARFPFPPYRGDRLTAYHLIRTLARRHRVTLLSFVDGHEPESAAREVGAFCERVETITLPWARSWAQAWLGLLGASPSQVSFYSSRPMARLVRGIFRETAFDAIVAQLFRMAPFAAELEHPTKVLFLADSIALSLRREIAYQPWWKRPGIAWEASRVARYEVEATRAFRENWVVSDVDARDLAARGAQNVTVVTHGVDERLFDLPLGKRNGSRVVFLGNLSVPHNIDAAIFLARDVWPQIRAMVSGAELCLMGADPVPAVRFLEDLPGVSVPGSVGDLLPMWQSAALLIAPLRFATGIQNKVLEAMAAGVPVVTMPFAAEGIGAENGTHLRVGSDAVSLANAAIDVLTNQDAELQMLERARTLVQEHFSWETAVRRLEALAAASGRPPVS